MDAQQTYILMTPNTDSYCTIASLERAEIAIKSSRFIASAASVATKEEALAYLQDIRKEFYDATHNCYAYRLGMGGLNFRFSDDGEPSGTAGRPILFALQKVDISDAVLVVTRYYGGTKLGVGPLARAYAEAAANVLTLCKRSEITRTTAMRVFCMYEDITTVKRLLTQYAVRYEESYGDVAEFVAYIPESQTQDFSDNLTNATSARAGVVLVEND